MKVIYYSYPFFADCDFPLVKALQDKGIDVHYYMPLPKGFQRSSILEFEKPQKGRGLVRASCLKEMWIYKECLDLDRLYLIKGYSQRFYWIPSWILWIKTLLHMKRMNADIIHIDWQFNNSIFEKVLFKFALGKKKVMTVHDPIMHSGQPNAYYEEQKRIQSFRWADYFILLNKIQSKEFVLKYSVSEDRISYSRLPNYDSINKITPDSSNIKGDFILFFGQIIPYKGLEYLLDAMMKVHEFNPKLRLVVAGRGQIYFDMSKYKYLDYIIWIQRYVGIRELAGLIKDAKFVVCPYKDATQSGVVHTSFAMGTPVIATNVGALPQSVNNGVTGILVPPQDIDSLADAIVSLANDRQLQNYFKKNIAKNGIINNNHKEIAEEYFFAYKQVLSI